MDPQIIENLRSAAIPITAVIVLVLFRFRDSIASALDRAKVKRARPVPRSSRTTLRDREGDLRDILEIRERLIANRETEGVEKCTALISYLIQPSMPPDDQASSATEVTHG